MLTNPCAEEEDAVKVLEGRLSRAPGFSLEMLKEKTFGRFESDLEFRLVHFASMPLYSESFDANAALRSCQDNTYNAESHSKSIGCGGVRPGAGPTKRAAQMTCTPSRRSTSTTGISCTSSRRAPWSSSARRTGSAHHVSLPPHSVTGCR